MTEKPELRWEQLNSQRHEKRWYRSGWETHRARVPGGWLVVVRGGAESPRGIAFYPDPEHRWNGGSLL